MPGHGEPYFTPMAGRFTRRSVNGALCRYPEGGRPCGAQDFSIVVAAAFAAWAVLGPGVGHAVSDPLTPPTALAPSDGAVTPAGAPVTFRVQGEADDVLVIHVSRSAQPASGCGTIGDDVATITPKPTADSSVYEATPQVFPLYEFWLNRPGTVWWQVYRIHYGDGADGCIEAAPRSLTVTGVRTVEVGPAPLEPADGAALPAGLVTFRVRANPEDQPNYLWVNVSRSPQLLAAGVIGFDAQLVELARSADPAIWTASSYQPAPGLWTNTPGTYWWQPHRISYFGDPDGKVEGPLRWFTITAAPPPAGPPPAQTIRGDRAFSDGSPNDLYLACTKLDLYLVDVLPAANGKVGVSGAADLRLAGRTVEILRDGQPVGTALVGAAGGFSARVAAPPRARRSSARYRARVGATLSQSLKLQRRMVAVDLTRRGSTLALSGLISGPRARRPATIGLQRYRSCGRKDTVTIRTVRPDRVGRFSVRFAVPPGAEKALMYRATTRVATRPGGPATMRTFTLPRALGR